MVVFASSSCFLFAANSFGERTEEGAIFSCLSPVDIGQGARPKIVELYKVKEDKRGCMRCFYTRPSAF